MSDADDAAVPSVSGGSAPSPAASPTVGPKSLSECDTWMPSKEAIAVALTTVAGRDRKKAIKKLRDAEKLNFCPHCSKRILGRKNRANHMHRCPAKKAKEVLQQDSEDASSVDPLLQKASTAFRKVSKADKSLSSVQIADKVCLTITYITSANTSRACHSRD